MSADVVHDVPNPDVNFQDVSKKETITMLIFKNPEQHFEFLMIRLTIREFLL